ncbi:MAG: carboxymuconolactone decarboxylase family protein [Candidatus Sulfotelmatobacter sp.]
MAAIKLVDPSEANGQVAFIFQKVEQQYGFTPNILKAIANCPDLLATFVPFWAAIYESPAIGPRLRAIAALATARAHDCNYCVSHMSASALKAGMTPAEIAATGPNGRLAEEKELLAVEFAHALTRNTSGVSDEMLRKLKAYFTDAELVNLTLVVGLYNLTGRLLTALRIDVEDALQASIAAACKTPEVAMSGSGKG